MSHRQLTSKQHSRLSCQQLRCAAWQHRAASLTPIDDAWGYCSAQCTFFASQGPPQGL